MVRRPEPRAADRRRDRHERQDDDVVPRRDGAPGGRHSVRPRRDDRDPNRGRARAQSGAEHDARRARAPADPPVDASRRRGGGRHRDEQPRARGGPGRERRRTTPRSSRTCPTSTSTSTARSRRTATRSSACSGACRATRRAAGRASRSSTLDDEHGPAFAEAGSAAGATVVGYGRAERRRVLAARRPGRRRRVRGSRSRSAGRRRSRWSCRSRAASTPTTRSPRWGWRTAGGSISGPVIEAFASFPGVPGRMESRATRAAVPRRHRLRPHARLAGGGLRGSSPSSPSRAAAP